MRLHHAVLPHPRRWLGWASLVIISYPRHWSEPLPDSGLGWATPDERRFSDTPCSDATNPYERAHHPTFCGASTQRSCLSYTVDDQHDVSRSNCVRRTRSRAVIMAGSTALRLNYRTTARNGFAAFAAPAPPPKVSFCSSPPPRTAGLGSTIPMDRQASPRLTPTLNPQLDYSLSTAPTVLQTTAPDNDISATAEHLSSNLLNYSHREWEPAQRADPLCDATRRYIQLGCPNAPSLSWRPLASTHAA